MAGFFSRLFGGASKGEAVSDSPDEVHKDIEIYAHPQKDDGQWRIAGTLSKPGANGAEAQSRKFMRADVLTSRDEAVKATISKAKMIIDQNGPSLWSTDPDRPV